MVKTMILKIFISLNTQIMKISNSVFSLENGHDRLIKSHVYAYLWNNGQKRWRP